MADIVDGLCRCHFRKHYFPCLLPWESLGGASITFPGSILSLPAFTEETEAPWVAAACPRSESGFKLGFLWLQAHTTTSLWCHPKRTCFSLYKWKRPPSPFTPSDKNVVCSQTSYNHVTCNSCPIDSLLQQWQIWGQGLCVICSSLPSTGVTNRRSSKNIYWLIK